MPTADPAANSPSLDEPETRQAQASSSREREVGPARPLHNEIGGDGTRTRHAARHPRPGNGHCAPEGAGLLHLGPCRNCLARHRGICAALSDEQLKQMGAHVVRRRFQAGRILQADGEEPVVCANLLHGVVKLTKILADGRQQIVALQFPPEFVGQPFGSESHLSAEAVSDIEVCSIPRSVLEEVMTSHPVFERRLFCDTLQQLDQARDWLLAIGRKTARERVAGLLHLIAGHLSSAATDEDAAGREQTFDLPLSRTEMADFLGLTIETVSRQITRLRQDGIISLGNNRRITIHAVDRLLGVAEG